MESFNGTFEHNFDSKNRLFVPSEFKQIIEGRITVRFGIAKFPHIDCFRESEFENAVAYEIEHPERPYPRDMLDAVARAYSKTIAVDNGGRICIPAKLLEKANITKECLVIGRGKYFQIWNPDIYDEYLECYANRVVGYFDADEAKVSKEQEYIGKGFFLDIKNTFEG